MNRVKTILLTVAAVVLGLALSSCSIVANFIAPGNMTLQEEWVDVEIMSSASGYTAVSPEDYYQYSQMSDFQKSLYDMFANAVKNGESVIDIGDEYYTADVVTKVYSRFLSDYPQYFYVTGNIEYGVAKDEGIEYIRIKYTDGVTVDDFNDNGNLSKTADRKLIAERIERFNSEVDKILYGIPAGLSQLELEKYLHDYLVDNVEYYQGTVDFNASPLPDYTNAYGGLVNGEGICQTYAELMQYLCYCVGINANQVSGTSLEDEAHVWNVAEIEGEWYHLDVTWDDPMLAEGQTMDYIRYDYFNRTDVDIIDDHIVDDEYNAIPTCNAETYKPENCYFAKMVGYDTAPENYKAMADSIAVGREDRIRIYLGYYSLNETYITEYFLDENSVFMTYVKSMGYDFKPEWSYTVSGKYCYIPVTR